MSFLDNLENNLNALERSQDTSDPSAEGRRRDAERQRALAAAPHAEKLKSSTFTHELLNQATAAGFQARTKVYIAWLGSTLRLEARGRKLELRPGADGITAVIMNGSQEVRSFPVTLEGDPGELVRELLSATA